MKKPLLKISLYVSLILMSWVIVGLAGARQQHKKVTGLRPQILNEENNHFLKMDNIRDLVRDIQGRPIEECERGDVKIAMIEDSLAHNPYVKFAEAYQKMNGEVVVELELRKPMARIMYDDGSGFYLDKEFKKVDLSSNFTANIILVRGLPREPLAPRDSVLTQELVDLEDFLRFVDRSEFLRSQISEIVVNGNGELVMYPEVGDMVIEFGKPDRIKEKFDNLDLFYRKVLNKVGWEKYEAISLKYRDQIVARK
jgi:cell division protein FtsQ